MICRQSMAMMGTVKTDQDVCLWPPGCPQALCYEVLPLHGKGTMVKHMGSIGGATWWWLGCNCPPDHTIRGLRCGFGMTCRLLRFRQDGTWQDAQIAKDTCLLKSCRIMQSKVWEAFLLIIASTWAWSSLRLCFLASRRFLQSERFLRHRRRAIYAISAKRGAPWCMAGVKNSLLA